MENRSLVRMLCSGALLLITAGPSQAQMVLVASSTNLFGVLNFATFSPGTTAKATKIGTLAEELVCLGYGSDGNLYGLDTTGNFYQVNQATAATNKIGNEIAVSGGIAAATWDGGSKMYVLDNAGTLQTVDLSTPSTHTTHSLGAINNSSFSADGFMSVDQSGHIFVGGTTNGNDQIYKVGGTSPTLTLTALPSDTGYINVGAGVNVNSSVYGFGADPNNFKSSIIDINTTTGSGALASYYHLATGGGLVTAAVVEQSTVGVPESDTLTLMSVLAGVGGLLLRRRKAHTRA